MTLVFATWNSHWQLPMSKLPHLRVLKHMLGYYCFAQFWLVLSISGKQDIFRFFLLILLICCTPFFFLEMVNGFLNFKSFRADVSDLSLLLFKVIVCGSLLVLMAVGNFANTVQTLVETSRSKAKRRRTKSRHDFDSNPSPPDSSSNYSRSLKES